VSPGRAVAKHIEISQKRREQLLLRSIGSADNFAVELAGDKPIIKTTMQDGTVLDVLIIDKTNR
jgi:hypothetical protein